LTTVFLYATPLVIVAVGIACLMHEVPLRTSTDAIDHTREMAAASAPGTADPQAAMPLGH
jgi:hypothetical protein